MSTDYPELLRERDSLRAERDLLAAQVVALTEALRLHQELDGPIAAESDCVAEWEEKYERFVALRDSLLADTPAAARDLLRELTELRERVEQAESDMTNMAHRSGPVWHQTAMRERERAERAEKALRDFAEHGTRHDTNPTVASPSQADVMWWYGYIKSMDDSVRVRARAYFATDADCDPMATETGRAVAEDANVHDCCEFRVFDRSVCACGLMHYYCGECGQQLDACEDAADAATEKENVPEDPRNVHLRPDSAAWPARRKER